MSSASSSRKSANDRSAGEAAMTAQNEAIAYWRNFHGDVDLTNDPNVQALTALLLAAEARGIDKMREAIIERLARSRLEGHNAIGQRCEGWNAAITQVSDMVNGIKPGDGT